MKRVFLFLFCLLSATGTNSESVPVYTHSASDGIILSSGERWYLEEFDGLERPVSGTLWDKGEIIEWTSWLYAADGQQAEKKIVTGTADSVETEYDGSGNIVQVIITNPKNEPVSTLRNKYNEKNLLTESELAKDKTVDRTELEYSDTDMINEKRVYTNGELKIKYVYSTEDNWTETIYNKNIPVLTVTFENGARKKVSYEKK